MLKLKPQYFCHLNGRVYSLEKILMLGKIEAKKERGDRGLDGSYGITNAMDISLSKL